MGAAPGLAKATSQKDVHEGAEKRWDGFRAPLARSKACSSPLVENAQMSSLALRGCHRRHRAAWCVQKLKRGSCPRGRCSWLRSWASVCNVTSPDEEHDASSSPQVSKRVSVTCGRRAPMRDAGASLGCARSPRGTMQCRWDSGATVEHNSLAPANAVVRCVRP